MTQKHGNSRKPQLNRATTFCRLTVALALHSLLGGKARAEDHDPLPRHRGAGHAARRDQKTGKLPMYHVYYGVEERWFTSRDDFEAFVKGKEKAAGGELAVGRVEEAQAAGDTACGYRSRDDHGAELRRQRHGATAGTVSGDPQHAATVRGNTSGALHP